MRCVLDYLSALYFFSLFPHVLHILFPSYAHLSVPLVACCVLNHLESLRIGISPAVSPLFPLRIIQPLRISFSHFTHDQP